jgi:hypothetical protein
LLPSQTFCPEIDASTGAGVSTNGEDQRLGLWHGGRLGFVGKAWSWPDPDPALEPSVPSQIETTSKDNTPAGILQCDLTKVRKVFTGLNSSGVNDCGHTNVSNRFGSDDDRAVHQ